MLRHGAATWYEDIASLSIHGQWLAQNTTQGRDTYAYDSLGRMTQAQETPIGKGCASTLYSYDEESNRTSETKREGQPGSGCPTTGGTTTAHAYDEANRLIDAEVEYEPLGGVTKVPAADAGGHSLESSYYATGSLYTQGQNGKVNTYRLDPSGRPLETTTEEIASSAEVRSTVPHYAGTGSTVAWTEEQSGAFTRNITGVNGAAIGTQSTQGVQFYISNLHGDVVGTVPDVQGASPTLESEPTAFGVPTAKAEPYSWLGTKGLKTEFESGVAGGGAGGAYVPQLGLHLEPNGLDGSASQDPINEYLNDRGAAAPIGSRTVTMPGAVEPQPVNQQIEEEFWAEPPWDKEAVNNLEVEFAEADEGENAAVAGIQRIGSTRCVRHKRRGKTYYTGKCLIKSCSAPAAVCEVEGETHAAALECENQNDCVTVHEMEVCPPFYHQVWYNDKEVFVNGERLCTILPTGRVLTELFGD